MVLPLSACRALEDERGVRGTSRAHANDNAPVHLHAYIRTRIRTRTAATRVVFVPRQHAAAALSA